MRIAFVLGTRPEIIKTAPLVFESARQEIDFEIVHTGQHYDWAMDGQFFSQLGLPKPAVVLASGGKPYAELFAYLLRELQAVLGERRPDAVVVQGDTVTVLAGALAARAVGIPVVHHEAGLRSRDLHMSEEYHRIIVDHMSDILCAPTDDAYANLRNEGVPAARVRMTGNTIVDAVRHFVAAANGTSDVHARLGVVPSAYFLLTFHRAENVDRRERFAACLESLRRVRDTHPDRPILFPVHPRVERRRAEFGFGWPEGVVVLDPLGYLDMLKLVADADAVLTDSGGIQEESAILGTPCVTLRDSTERPEAVASGANIVAGVEPAAVSAAVAAMRGKRFPPSSAYGDGAAAARVVAAVRDAAAGSDGSKRQILL